MEVMIRTITLILHPISPESNSGVSDVARGGTNPICEIDIDVCTIVNLDFLTSNPLMPIYLVSNMNCKREDFLPDRWIPYRALG